MNIPLSEKMDPSLFPKQKKILVLSPHPDDDVISMGATLSKFLEHQNEVHIVYAVTGANSVRTSLPEYKTLFKKVQRNHSHLTEGEQCEETRAQIRENEAKTAVELLGLKPQSLHFLRADYYKRRNIQEGKAITPSDIEKMGQLLGTVKPDIVFFAAESDPHGAHDLASMLLVLALENNPSLSKSMSIFGYRGAYTEWSLDDPEQLWIVPFDKTLRDLKTESIKAHQSQLNPLYPAGDPREFYQRVWERNTAAGTLLTKLLAIEAKTGQKEETIQCAEVFKRFSYKEFIELYGSPS